jgi:uncharacterized membrane protein YcaP (DUF421 family)
MDNSDNTSFAALVFSHPTFKGGVDIAAKTSIIYLFLVIGLRLTGRRQLGQMNLYDVVLVVVLANAVQNAMVGDDNTLVGGIVAAIVLLLWNRFFSFLMHRSSRAERLLVGGPIILVNDGKYLDERLRREGVTREQVQAAMRSHGVGDVAEAHMCILEADGTISVVPNSSPVHKSNTHFKGLRLS